MSFRSITGRDPASGEPIEVQLEGSRIHSIVRGSPGETAWLSSGFIDLQVNGYGGFDLNADSIDPSIVISLTQKLFSTGVTTYLPTLITAPEEKLIAALRVIAEARKMSPLVAHAIPFVHVEGPCISAADGPRGAHPLEHVRAPSLAEFERWQAASSDLVGMVTISPHWEGALEYTSALASKGVLVAVGHTDATPKQIHAVVDAGANLSTHLGNGVAGVLPRHPNLIWAQLAEDRLAATFIADGHHLSRDTLKAMVRAKGIKRSILVSDSVALAGMLPGTYHTPVGGRVELSADGRLSLAGTSFLAGAARPLKDGVAYVASMGAFSLGDAILMVTENPGRYVAGRGVLRVGAEADLVRFHWGDQDAANLKLLNVVVQGIEQ